MTSVGIVFLVAAAVLMAGCLYMMRRNNEVLRFRQELIEKVSHAAQDDITAGDFNWQWRYEMFDSVPYNRMMLSVRRLRPESYYRDMTFLEGRR